MIYLDVWGMGSSSKEKKTGERDHFGVIGKFI